MMNTKRKQCSLVTKPISDFILMNGCPECGCNEFGHTLDKSHFICSNCGKEYAIIPNNLELSQDKQVIIGVESQDICFPEYLEQHHIIIGNKTEEEAEDINTSLVNKTAMDTIIMFGCSADKCRSHNLIKTADNEIVCGDCGKKYIQRDNRTLNLFERSKNELTIIKSITPVEDDIAGELTYEQETETIQVVKASKKSYGLKRTLSPVKHSYK